MNSKGGMSLEEMLGFFFFANNRNASLILAQYSFFTAGKEFNYSPPHR
jgi:hypothetical protein